MNDLFEYEVRYESIAMLWEIVDETEGKLRERVKRVIKYLRETAMDSLPWPADVLPNRSWNGKRCS